jgi:hypothetical protein
MFAKIFIYLKYFKGISKYENAKHILYASNRQIMNKEHVNLILKSFKLATFLGVSSDYLFVQTNLGLDTTGEMYFFDRGSGLIKELEPVHLLKHAS